MLSLILIIMVWFNSSPAGGVERSLIISEKYQSQMLGRQLEVLEDKDGQLSFAEIQASKGFTTLETEIPLYSFSKSAYWFRFTLQSMAAKPQTLYLQAGCSWLDQLRFYQPAADGSWAYTDIGDTLPFHVREVPSILPTFKIELPAQKQQVYYLRVQTQDAFILPLFLRSESAHYAYERLKEYLSGSLFGLIGVMFFFNLIVFIFSRDLAYLVYSVNLLAWFMLFFTLDGYAFAWLWPESDWWTNRSYVFAITMSTLWGSLFAKEFLKTKEHVPRIDRAINIWLWSQLGLVAGIFVFPYHWTIIVSCVYTVIFCVMVSPIALIVLKRGFYPARYYLCSWIFPAYAAFYYLAIIFGFIPANATNIYILHIGIALEVIMLSVALGDRMRKLTQERKDLQQGFEVARVVQESFLLQDIRVPWIATDYLYQPSDHLGGDWFACLERTDQHRLFVCLGDVTGHGIATSLVTGAAAGSFQTAVMALPEHLSLEEANLSLAAQLNDTILRIGARQNAMMTAVLVAIDLDSLEASYLNAGHVNIFVKSRQSVRAYLRRGSILGFCAGPKFHPLHLQLADDDSLILFSDGLLENYGPKAQQLNQKSLARMIEESPDSGSLKTNLLHLTEQRSWRFYQKDDSTMLILQLKRRQPETKVS